MCSSFVRGLVTSWAMRAGRMAVVSGEGPAERGVGVVAGGAGRGVHARAAGQQLGGLVEPPVGEVGKRGLTGRCAESLGEPGATQVRDLGECVDGPAAGWLG